MARTDGILSKGIKLSYDSSQTSTPSWVDLDNLQSIPDLGAAPEQVETTCLSDGSRTYIEGIKNYGSLEFTFLYDATIYNTINGLGRKSWKVELGDELSGTGTHHGSQFVFEATASCALSGVGVNEAQTFKVTLTLHSDIDFTAAA